MTWIVLDGNVIAELCGSGEAARLIGDFLVDRKKRGDSILVVPQVIAECERAGETIANRLLDGVVKWCDGAIARDAKEVMTQDLVTPNPYDSALKAGIVPSGKLPGIRKTRKDQMVQGFLQDQKVDYEDLKKLLPELDRRIGHVDKKDLPTFGQYVEERRLNLFDGFLQYAIEQGYLKIPKPRGETDLERLWRRGNAYQLVILILIANEFRSIARTRAKGEGCMTDIRGLIEAAYSDEFLTKDVELFECGAMLAKEKLLAGPKFSKWPAY